LGAVLVGVSLGTAHAQGSASGPPIVFAAAGPNADSIRGTVEAFRVALGDPNNGNGPAAESGRREINWDGGGANDTTSAPVTPFDVFLNTRGARFTTPGTGLSQAPPAGGPQGGLATLFGNPTYGTIFTPFSALRLFTPVGSRITDSLFFVPGTNGATAATVKGFGAVFTDVDRPDGSGPALGSGHRKASTRIDLFGVFAHGNRSRERLLFSGLVPASPGDGSLSFFGVVFDDAVISRVRITAGNVAPGPNDDRKHDVVMMDDFIYGEPQPAQQ
jgi:hypothetical protein